MAGAGPLSARSRGLGSICLGAEGLWSNPSLNRLDAGPGRLMAD
jgi:hypothetical protein